MIFWVNAISIKHFKLLLVKHTSYPVCSEVNPLILASLNKKPPNTHTHQVKSRPLLCAFNPPLIINWHLGNFTPNFLNWNIQTRPCPNCWLVRQPEAPRLMLRAPVNEAKAGQPAGLIGSGPGGTKGPRQVTQLPAALRDDDISWTLLNQFS